MPHLVMTVQLAHAVMKDAGDRSMRAAGRRIWNADDYDAGVDAFHRALPCPEDAGCETCARIKATRNNHRRTRQ